VIKFDWRWIPKEKSIELTFRQMQTGTFFRLPVELEIIDAAGKSRHQMWLDKPEINIELPHPQKPETLIFDPDEKILLNLVK